MPLYQVVPSKSDVFTALRTFLLQILPAGIEVVQGQDNRVAAPVGPDFVAIWPLFQERLETNVDSQQDVFFVGTLDGATMNVTSISFGTIETGNQLFGPTVAASTIIGTQIDGTPGGIGHYNISPSQTITSGPLACGGQRLAQNMKLTLQIDVHGPNSYNNATIISTLMRDQFAFDAIQAINPNVAPLAADNPRQAPYDNENQQIEERWSFDAELQVNETVIVPQQFASAVTVVPVSVDVAFPPT